MSLRIDIHLPDGDVSADMLDAHLGALGFTRGLAASTALTSAGAAVVTETATETAKPATTRKRTPKKDETPAPTVEDTAETQEQDADDEANEVEEDRNEDEPLTVDDVKNAVGKYVAKFGMPAVQKDGVKVFNDVLGQPPKGEQFWKMTILPTDQPTLKKIVEAWEEAAASDKRYGEA